VIDLLEFQRQATDSIADRYAEYWEDPAITGRRNTLRALPFFQSLASITASGKTVILAAAVADISAGLPVKPIVLWISRGKVVVEQSYANLAEGGRYHHLLGDAVVHALAEYDKSDVAEATRPLVYFATVGTFNQKDKDQGSRLIYKCDIDTTDQSTWDALKSRLDKHGQRRPLIVVYDEAHNLSDQQTDLLLELDPQALLMASATMRLPARLAAEIQELKAKTSHDDGWLVTQVDSRAVADAGLVKSTVLLAGYKSPMEETLDALIDDLRQAEVDADAYGLLGKPKAIYVSQTNIVEGNAYQTDDPKQQFTQRQAPPILIWRYLVEHHGVDPESIAVYCSLKFDKNYPPPAEFRLFKGGDNDYQDFVAGDFQHVIFNLTLQEGWDDPLAYFAYIDKSMESRVQVEQIIGRVLRQPGVRHYPSERLNTAHFYVRVDRNAVFDSLIAEVGQRLRSDAPAVKLVTKSPDKAKPVELPTRKVREVPGTAYDTSDAIEPIAQLIVQFTDYRGDTRNTLGEGARRVVTRTVGVDAETEAQWESYKRSNIVSARWLFTREVRRLFQNALGIAPTSDPKFDALVGVGSPAHAHIQTLARQVVDVYLDNVYLKQRKPDAYVVGPQLVRTDEMIAYEYSLHEGYDGLNQLERDFAEALDRLGSPWCRNPSRSGYGIPLITPGTTSTFYPDFLVWRGSDVIAIDTTGGHLLPEKAARKLLAVHHPSTVTCRIVIRFVSDGRWTASPHLTREDSEGFTVWELSPNQERRAIHVEDLNLAVARAVKAPP
jgi:type III restriction enzyme